MEYDLFHCTNGTKSSVLRFPSYDAAKAHAIGMFGMTETREQLAKRLIGEAKDELARELAGGESQRIAESEWHRVPEEFTAELQAAATKGRQVLAYEGGRYYNAWLEFSEREGGWIWMDDSDSEPAPTHYTTLPPPPHAARPHPSQDK